MRKIASRKARTNMEKNRAIEIVLRVKQERYNKPPKVKKVYKEPFKYIVKTSDSLLEYLAEKSVSQYTPRGHYKSMLNFCTSENRMIIGKIGVLSGLYNTGKTTLMLQVIDGLITKKEVPANKVAYISVTSKNTDMKSLCHIINNIEAKCLFVDNITKVKDFTEKATMLLEYVDSSKRLVISGDCVYAFNKAIQHTFYGRAIKWGTNMGFKEYNSLFSHEIKNRHNREVLGQFMTKDSLSGWMNYAGMGNPYTYVRDIILHDTIEEMKKDPESLTKWGRGLINLSEYKLVYLVFMTILRVDRVVNYKHCVSSSKELRRQVDKAMARYAPVSEIETLVSLEQNMESYCSEMLDLMTNIGVISPVHNIIDTNDRAGIYRETDIEYICNIPSLMYNIVEASMVEGAFDMSDGMLGVLNENIIASQCCLWAERRSNVRVYYARYSIDDRAQRIFGDNNKMPEVDLVIQQTDVNSMGKLRKKHILIEVKTNTNVNGAHTKNINSNSIKEAIPNINKKYCVYGGDTRLHGGVQYINVFDFLLKIDAWLQFSN